MKKKIKNLIEAKVAELEKEYNPYKAKSIKYYIGKSTVYIWNGQHLTEKDAVESYVSTATKDIINGYRERMVGWYDKWYRYTRADEGRAYDAGQKLATMEDKCPETFNIIEMNNI